MPFCPKCGHQVEEGHKFCYKCGQQMQTTESKELEKQGKQIPETKVETQIPVIDPKKSLSTYSIDRKTLFDDGLLVLTSSDLILYSSDEKDELKRIPLSIIEGCSYSMLKRGLVIKKKANAEENLSRYLDQLEDDIESFQNELEGLDNLIDKKDETIEDLDKQIKKAEYDEEAKALESQIVSLENEIEQHEEEKENIEEKIEKTKEDKGTLGSDPIAIKEKEDELADIEKEVIKLPKNFSANHSAKDEYKIWEYIVKRRILGPSKIKISSIPYGAIITINEEVVGTTPLVTELPINDEAILKGRYTIQLLKDGFSSPYLKP